MEIFKSELFIRLLGITGLAVTFAAFQSNKHKNVVIMKICSECVFAVQYLCKGAYTGFILNLLGAFRNISYTELEKRNKNTKYAVWFWLVVFTIAAFCTKSSDGLAFVFPLVGKLISTYAYSLKNARHIRILTVPTALMWIIYNSHFGMWEAIIADTISLVSVSIGAIRFDLIPYIEKKKVDKQ